MRTESEIRAKLEAMQAEGDGELWRGCREALEWMLDKPKPLRVVVWLPDTYTRKVMVELDADRPSGRVARDLLISLNRAAEIVYFNQHKAYLNPDGEYEISCVRVKSSESLAQAGVEQGSGLYLVTIE